ncbi:MAG: hypothetical protein U0074_02285 [Kouleothrix sp.]
MKLYASDGTTEIAVGPDGILGTADDAPGGVQTDAKRLIPIPWAAAWRLYR